METPKAATTLLQNINKDMYLIQGGDGITILPGPIDGFLWRDDKSLFAIAKNVEGETHTVPVEWTPYSDPIDIEHKNQIALILSNVIKTFKPEKHPYEQDDALNDRLYNVSRKVDKILHREPVENHAAILGMIQVSTQRRMHEHQQAQQKAQQSALSEAQRRAQFGIQ